MKVLIFRFCGGLRDGQVVRSDQPGEQKKETETFWKLTWMGTVGRRFDAPAPGSLAYQRYQVTGKYQIDDEVHVTCEHVG